MFDKINIGTAPNAGDGDSLRDAFNKVNENYDDTYTKEEVDTKLAGIEVDLSDYDTKAEVDAKIQTAVDGVDVDLTNYYNKGEVDSQIGSITLSRVLNNGGTTNGTMKVGPVTYSNDYYPIYMPDGRNPDIPGFQLTQTGGVTASHNYTIANGNNGKIIFSDNSAGVIRVFDDNNLRRTRVRFATPTANNEVVFPDKGGTVAMLSDITGIPDAPIDGQLYARQDGNWAVVPSGGSTDPGAQNLALVGTNSYKLLTSNDHNITHGANSLYFSNRITGSSVTLGQRSISFGSSCLAIGANSMSGGQNNESKGIGSIAWGRLANTNHQYSFAFGFNIQTTNNYGTVVGMWNESTGTATSSLFTVGNGTGNTNRTNAFEVLNTGVILAPNLSLSELESAPDTALTTKEYVNSPDRLIEALTNATTEELDEIKGLLGIV